MDTLILYCKKVVYKTVGLKMAKNVKEYTSNAEESFSYIDSKKEESFVRVWCKTWSK